MMTRSTPKYLVKTALVGAGVGIGLAGALAFFLIVMPTYHEVGEYVAADMSGDPRHGLGLKEAIVGFGESLLLGMILGALAGILIGVLGTRRRRNGLKADETRPTQLD